MSWITFQLGSLLLASINSILDKRLMRDQASSPVIQLASFAIIGLPVAMIGIWTIPWTGTKPVVMGLTSGLIFSLAVVLYYSALNLDDVSRLVPILRLSGTFQLILLGIILNDRLTLLQYLAFVAMLIGAFAISWRARQPAMYRQSNLRIRTGVLLMTLVAILLACQGVLNSYLNLNYSPWVLTTWSNAGTIIGFGLTMLSSKKRAELIAGVSRMSPPLKGLILGQQISRLMVDLLSYFAVNQAGSAAIAFVFGGLRPVLVLGMAVLFLGEQIDHREKFPKVVGSCLFGIGTGLLLLRP